MLPTEGFYQEQGNVCKLKKALYGLKQTVYLWKKKINRHLTEELGFTRCKSGPCIYTRNEDGRRLILGLYVE